MKIKLVATTEDRRDFYGLLFESEATYTIRGRGVHNSGSQHKIQIWMAKQSKRTDDAGKVVYRDCNGNVTTRGALTFQTSAQSAMIAATPVDAPARGGELLIGDTLDLGVFGKFELVNKFLHDPILVEIDG